jgi:hypothetical protein
VVAVVALVELGLQEHSLHQTIVAAVLVALEHPLLYLEAALCMPLVVLETLLEVTTEL